MSDKTFATAEAYPELDFDPVSISHDLTHAIGAVSVAYALLEYSIHMGICCMLNLSEEAGLVVTTHMPMPAKLQMFETLLDISELPPPQRAALVKAKNAVGDAAARRNGIVHDSWALREDGVELRISTKARGKLVLVGVPVDLAEIRRDADFVRATGLDFVRLLRDFGLTSRSPQ